MNTKVSKAQQEVWDWKNKAFEKLQNVPRKEWLKEIRRNTKEMVEKLNKSVQLQQK